MRLPIPPSPQERSYFAGAGTTGAGTVCGVPFVPSGPTGVSVKGTVDPQGQFTPFRFQVVSEAQFQENLANSLPGFEGAATLIEIGIALSTMAIITRRTPLWFGAMGLGAAGVVLFALAYLG